LSARIFHCSPQESDDEIRLAADRRAQGSLIPRAHTHTHTHTYTLERITRAVPTGRSHARQIARAPLSADATPFTPKRSEKEKNHRECLFPLALACLTCQARDSLAQMTRPSPRVTRRKVAKFTLFSPSKPSTNSRTRAEGRVRSRRPNIYIYIYISLCTEMFPSRAHAAHKVANPSPFRMRARFAVALFILPPPLPSPLARFFPRRNISTEIPRGKLRHPPKLFSRRCLRH